MSRLLFSALVFLCPMLTEAASFDCATASSAVEHAICADAQLSALDERLAHEFRLARQFASPGDNSLLQAQRYWLGEVRRQCTAQREVKSCLQEHYQNRLSELASLPHEQTEFKPQGALRIDKASEKYDFLLTLDAPCDEQFCASSGQLAILAKGDKRPLQNIALPNVFLTRHVDAKVQVNSAHPYGLQGVIYAGDYNFDGFEDFAVQNGNHSSYGGPSYEVFLYAPQYKAFRHSQALTELISSTLGFFTVEKKQQRLLTSSKSGCCWHSKSLYKVENNMPVEVWRLTEDAAGGSDVTITTQELRNGRWQVLKKTTLPRES